MDHLLVLLAVSDPALDRHSRETLGAAQALASALGCPWQIGLLGPNPAAAAPEAATYGSSQVWTMAHPELVAARYASDRLAAEALVRASGATLVLAPDHSRWNRVLPGLAQRLGGRIDTHLTGLAAGPGGTIQATRWFYRQRLVGEFTRTPRPWLMTLAVGAFPAASAAAGAPSPVRDLPLELPAEAARTRLEIVAPAAEEEQTIRPDAKVLFVTGAGWTKKQGDGKVHAQEAEILILDFLHRTQASLGSTKSLVDLGTEGHAVLPFLTHLHQVGQTGSTPRHPKGLATCCHGEEPHAVGWRFISERRAINLDPNCGWAQGKADVLYVADSFAVMRRVNELLADPASADV